MKQMFQEIFQYRDLLWMLTLRDIKIRYKQAVMGFIWAVFMPIVAICAGILIKKAMSVVSGQPMDEKSIISIAIKVLPWTFFISSIRFSVQSLVGNSSLITKIYFPRAVLPLSAILACFFDFFIASLSLPFLMVIFHVKVSIYLLWMPFFLFILVTLTAGLGLLLASANLFYRDIKYVVEIILMFGIFFTPVFYEARSLGKFENLLLLNPIGSLLESINSAFVLRQMPDLFWLGYASLCAFVIFISGMFIFHKSEPYFAENI